MKVLITENLRIDLEKELWECRHCDAALVSARDNYKRGLLVYDRDPREIHKPLLDPSKYKLTYSPDPQWCRILEYYCPQCGSMIETEYLPPGHPPVRDIDLDIDALKAQWRSRDEVLEAPVGTDPPRRLHDHDHAHGHGHDHGARK
ncbi:acetone carboxylase subunit gamma [Sinimarinibacterium sp. CAU 1509]|uniref:acetone carboxylase subunit gamma n=1 Tax=Sinimarinibacterium sp. CAU 1509 TaxID=2562283 RepID=UPI0010ABFA97|nr:acetone carboxylase subunit gamma [Sinimarinibacterium sp. CAU 1509]TJY63273.1 acetone carboxylase subunit gamma [Sinimarinibacterium sp. CAU 1509]